MRRILLGGFALALGVFTPTAFAQQPTSSSPATRAATFGKPVALPNPTAPSAPSDPDVTQAGLLRKGPARPTVTYSPGTVVTPTPVLTQPPSMAPSPMPMSDTKPEAQPSAPPMVTESRDPTGRIPNGTIVPSVCPDPFTCPTLGLEDPLHKPRAGMNRVRGFGAGHNWVSAELLLWWNSSSQVPALVTTSSPQFNGIVGQGDTQVLLGGSFGDDFHAGGRIGGGHWFDDNECRGFDWRLFWLSPSSATFTAGVPPFAILARPFNNVNPGTAPFVGFGSASEVVAGPGVANGSVTATMQSTAWGAEANYRRNLGCYWGTRFDALVGYRYLDVRDELTITESFTRVPGADATTGIPAQMGIITDSFRTENHFHGGQIGLSALRQRGRWSIDARGTLAFGTVFQSAEINGGQLLTFGNGAQTVTSGGLLAVPGANIGRFTQSQFAVVPEIGVNFGYQVTSNLKMFVGYNLLYLSSAIRPAGTIDPNLDAARIPNFLPPGAAAPVLPVRPVPRFDTNGYTLQGIQFGLVYRW
jgi:hypothetical protein